MMECKHGMNGRCYECKEEFKREMSKEMKEELESLKAELQRDAEVN